MYVYDTYSIASKCAFWRIKYIQIIKFMYYIYLRYVYPFTKLLL